MFMVCDVVMGVDVYGSITVVVAATLDLTSVKRNCSTVWRIGLGLPLSVHCVSLGVTNNN